jgi:hypothetical protein
MNQTRVDSQALREAVAMAVARIEEAIDGLEPHLEILSEAQRAVVPRVRTDFPAAGRKLAAESGKHPDIVAATDYDAAAVWNSAELVDGALMPQSRLLFVDVAPRTRPG